MKNKKHIKIDVIPLGINRSVEWDDYMSARIPTGMHPYRMQERGIRTFFTERCIPNGILFQKFKLLQVDYFASLVLI